MIKELMHDPIFLAGKSEVATKEDLQVAQDLLDTLMAHRESCVGMAANMIGVRKRIIAFLDESGRAPTYTVMLNPEIAADAVRKIAAGYDIKTVMTFGGEPLLYTDAVYAIMKTAMELNIPRRQVITNGYFSKNADRICEVAEGLAKCGVNDLLLSVDAFHQETIPSRVVKRFAAEAKSCDIPIRLQPAWLRSAVDDNPYNRKTREILDSFSDMGISVNEGNVIFPEGNALKYLAEYFTDELPENPYVEDPRDVRCVSFEPNGDVLGGNVYESDIMEIIKDYLP